MATITGSAGDDRLVGTAAADRLVGRGGNDELFGRGGGDLLDGGGGNDRLAGGAGADTLLGATGGDFFRGEAGALDSINGVPGVDTLSYSQVVGRGVEVCLASDESCDLRTDVVAGVEVAIGSRQSDVIDGSDVETSALIRGLEGDDVIVGSFNDDRLFGGPGDDLLVSERDGDDVVHGGLGNDQIGSGSGDDLLFGEGGRDLFEYDVIVFAGEFGGADVVADFTRGQDVLALRFTDFDGITRGTFDDLDSNGNGRLGDRDAFVEVVRVTLGGVTGISTVIDVGGFAVSVGLPVSGTNTLTVFGVTGLTAGDLAGESLG